MRLFIGFCLLVLVIFTTGIVSGSAKHIVSTVPGPDVENQNTVSFVLNL